MKLTERGHKVAEMLCGAVIGIGFWLLFLLGEAVQSWRH